MAIDPVGFLAGLLGGASPLGVWVVAQWTALVGWVGPDDSAIKRQWNFAEVVKAVTLGVTTALGAGGAAAAVSAWTAFYVASGSAAKLAAAVGLAAVAGDLIRRFWQGVELSVKVDANNAVVIKPDPTRTTIVDHPDGPTILGPTVFPATHP
jgi:hypothetical protein